MTRILRGLVATAVVVMMAISGLAITSGTAAAEDVGVLGCTATGADKDNSAYYRAFKATVNIRSGRSTNCASLGLGYTSHTVDIHCTSYYNGTDWTYLRDATTGVKGWVKSSLLNWKTHRLISC